MTTTIKTAYVNGITAHPISVTCCIERGLPCTTIIGVTSNLAEIIETVRCAIRASDYTYPRDRVTVQVSPQGLPVSSYTVSTAIAASILVESGQVASFDGLVVGELYIDGHVLSPRGSACIARLANELGVNVFCGDTLRDLSDAYAEPESVKGVPVAEGPSAVNDSLRMVLQDAVAGRHSLLMLGANGTEQIMRDAAREALRMMPPLTDDEAQEVACAMGAGGIEGEVTRSFRAPYHSISPVGLIGGGKPIMPGEITLANHGVLYLEDLHEFSPAALRHLSCAMCDKSVTITRNTGTTTMPADFMLIASAKPCPCGNFGNPDRDCTCSPNVIMRYQGLLFRSLDFGMVVSVSKNDAVYCLNKTRED